MDGAAGVHCGCVDPPYFVQQSVKDFFRKIALFYIYKQYKVRHYEKYLHSFHNFIFIFDNLRNCWSRTHRARSSSTIETFRSLKILVLQRTKEEFRFDLIVKKNYICFFSPFYSVEPSLYVHK